MTIQLLVLIAVSYAVTKHPFVNDTWFIAGLLAIVINPQLLEPYYPRPGDVVANGLIVFFLAANERKTITAPGWLVFTYFVATAISLAALALVLGAGRRSGRFFGLANSARILSQIASARVLYSVVFLLSAVEFRPSLNSDFWKLITVWALILLVGKVNWQAVWATTRGHEEICRVEGMIGPCGLLVSAPNLPAPGSTVSLKAGSCTAIGVVTARIRRVSDTWGQVHVADSACCESILIAQTLAITPNRTNEQGPIGSVDAGSTDTSLKFIALRPLEIGQVVGVSMGNSLPYVLYQLSSAFIEQRDIKGGAHLVVRAIGNQLGVFDPENLYFRQHRWVPLPGGPIYGGDKLKGPSNASVPADLLLLGNVIGTDIPIFLNYSLACEGHVAILGMTKMGKSTLAARIANDLSKNRRVTILDQTGEYVGKRGFARYDKNVDMKTPGVTVFEPKVGEVAADRAFEFLNYIVKIALEEYKAGIPFPRVVIIDEAHQFIPEPAGLGFAAPGRDSSFKIGALLMQIRKYGISVFLISQRTAVVAKSALSQCENLIAFRSVDQTGLDYLEAVAGGEIRSLLPQLRQGEALVFGPAVSADGAVAIDVSKG